MADQTQSRSAKEFSNLCKAVMFEFAKMTLQQIRWVYAEMLPIMEKDGSLHLHQLGYQGEEAQRDVSNEFFAASIIVSKFYPEFLSEFANLAFSTSLKILMESADE